VEPGNWCFSKHRGASLIKVQVAFDEHRWRQIFAKQPAPFLFSLCLPFGKDTRPRAYDAPALLWEKQFLQIPLSFEVSNS
jgi:hypothetical protein